MKYLLDTHVIIWALEENPLLSQEASEAIVNSDHQIFYSTVSLWEIAIKRSIKKLKLNYTIPAIAEELDNQSLFFLPLDVPSIEEAEKLPFPTTIKHGDPFDRALIAQARTHELTIITKDEKFEHYDVKLLW